MSVVNNPRPEPNELLELHTGDRMTQAEFHRVYRQMPAHFRAELIGGVVYVESPLKRQHGANHLPLGTLFFTYEMNAPGVESGDNATILLGEASEPQPDLYLRVLPEFGGQSRTTADDYVAGAPELLTEIALSSRSMDLHGKREDYARFGVGEYLVVCLRERAVRWFDLRQDRELQPDAGVIRVQSFPGLWIDVEALLAKDRRLMDVLRQGLASPEHADFVARLQANRG